MVKIMPAKSPFLKLAMGFFRSNSYPGGYYGLILNYVYTNLRIKISQFKKLNSKNLKPLKFKKQKHKNLTELVLRPPVNT